MMGDVMSRRHIHYENAFADFLRSRGVPFVPVNEQHRAIFAGNKVKSFDFLVYTPSGTHWIVDVKGRRFPYRTSGGDKHYWENWVTREDLHSLADWANAFGDNFEARFVFSYLLEGSPDRWPAVCPHPYKGRLYAFLAVKLSEYSQLCRLRSLSWDTVSMSRARFRQIVHPIRLRGLASERRPTYDSADFTNEVLPV
jgi:hypothetical protein